MEGPKLFNVAKQTTRPPAIAFSYVLFGLLVIISGTVAEMADSAVAQQSEQFAKGLGQFSANMYSQLTSKDPTGNIIFSPFSIQTCVAMARLGATGETAEQLDRGLGLVSSDANVIADSFHSVLEQYEKSSILKIANKIYVMDGFTVKPAFNELVSKKFFSTAEEIDFSKNTAAANTINSWVESKTNNLIKDLIQPSALDENTRLVLLNAIHFKGLWEHAFDKTKTKIEDFYLNESDKVQVPMMHQKARFRYADLPELNAAALEMSYKDSDLSMLVILPNSRTGLKELEAKLKDIPLSEISKKLYYTQVIVKFPKFKTEFSIELNDQFKQLGMGRMFTGQAEFPNMLEGVGALQVSKIIHKAFIEVNEEGTEAAAATGVTVRMKRSVVQLSEPMNFIAEHPFSYALIHATPAADAHLPLFVGTLATLSSSANWTAAADEHDEL